MKRLATPRELVSLIKNNLISGRNIILGEEKRKKRILNMALLFILFIASTEVSLVKIFNMLHAINNEILIFNSILNIQLIITTLLIFTQIMNKFYLASDWKEMMVYPIKSGNLLLSKAILCYFSSVLISICVLILLFSYGILTHASIMYYLHVTIYEIIIAAVPVTYIVLISLTIFWIIAVIKKSKSKDKSNKWLIIIDLAVIMLTYMILNPALSNHIKVSSLLFNVFFSANQSKEILVKFMIVLFIVIFSCLGFYFIGGNVYLTIMKNGIFRSKHSKRIELQLEQYDFKLRNPIVSNIIRDAKLIMRVPVLRVNCITLNAICSTIAVIVLILFRKQVINIGSIFADIKSFLVILWFLSFEVINCTFITSFSREGRALNQFKVFPLDGKKVLLSKLCIGNLTNIFTFININVLMALIASNLGEFILLEILIVIYIISISIIQIEIDMDNIELKWVDIKDLFQNEHYLKILKPYFILTILPGIYIIVASRLFHQFSEYSIVGFEIFIAVIYSMYSFKKIITNMK
ncbi:hypothetical protein [Clostridium hydrogenum]|uniref:hypothetical protein n=1 Tax=Clostridium hydrogenum TaxID=2855764 RepID=UPI001F326770|nr:hypothetical protein [Clostridium hydrogenum]